MNKKYLYIAIFFACTGFLLSVVLGKIGLNLLGNPSYHSFCNISESLNCDAVALSSYSSHFGIPNFLFGMVYYFVILIAGSLCLISEGKKLKNFFVYLFWLSLISLIISFYLFLVSVLVIQSKCIMCISVYFVNIILFVVALMAEKFDLNHLLKELINDIKLYFSSGLRILLFVLLLITGITVITFTNSHPILSQQTDQPENTANIDYTASTADRLVHGPKETPEITMIMFTDYECHFCGKTAMEIKKVLKKNPNIRLIFKDYPLDMSCNERVTRPFHMQACNASLAARCAAEQGKFWEYHDLLYNNQGQINLENIKQFANNLNLDMKQFNQCLSNKKHLNKIITDIDEGVALGIEGTPTIYINGEQVVGYKTAEEYQQIIDQVRLEKQKEREEFEKRKQEYFKKIKEQKELEKQKHKSNGTQQTEGKEHELPEKD